MFGFMNLAIEIYKPFEKRSWALALIYLSLLVMVTFLDAIIVKSKAFVFGVGILFVIVNVYRLYSLFFGDSNLGIRLIEYTIYQKEYVIYKRASKRSIYIQVVLFSLSGLWTLFRDLEMKKLMFVTDPIYRATGTTSPHALDAAFADDRSSRSAKYHNDESESSK